VVARDVQISKRFPRAVIIPVRYEPEGEPVKEKTKRRQGYKPLVVTAAEAGGTLQTNLIISEEDAKKLKAVDDKTNVLKECKVVVVVSSEVGGLEGRLRSAQNESYKTHTDR
ncbi:MAG TPA: hypothetical protein VJ521_10340, partial [Acidobacteriota bacterium]|nr:hypothetical protein [Acidobacteriota bacterium]